MPFQLTQSQDMKLQGWIKTQDRKVAAKQRGKFANYGAVGGGYTYY
jgi:hypothetical protein